MSKLSCEIIIPSYNEGENLPKLLSNLDAIIKKKPFSVILVNNGSTDNTKDILDKFNDQFEWLNILHIEKNIGYGHGIASGLQLSTADIIGWTHADLQFEMSALVVGIQTAEQNPNIIVKGRRVGTRLSSKVTTFGMSLMGKIIMGLPLMDINAQPKIFSRGFYEKNIKGDSPVDFSFDLFFLWRALKSKSKIQEINVLFLNRNAGIAKGGGASIRTIITISWRTLKYMWRIRNDNF